MQSSIKSALSHFLENLLKKKKSMDFVLRKLCEWDHLCLQESLLTRVQVTIIELKLLGLRKHNWVQLSPHTLDPHYDIPTKWWFGIFLNTFNDCELTTAHSIQGGMIGSQALCKRKCLDEEQRSFLGWRKAMVMVLEMWIWYVGAIWERTSKILCRSKVIEVPK